MNKVDDVFLFYHYVFYIHFFIPLPGWRLKDQAHFLFKLTQLYNVGKGN